MNVADLMELLKHLDPMMRVVVADAVGIFGAQPEDLHVVEFGNNEALLIAPFEFVESWDASNKGSALPAQEAVEVGSHPPRVVVDPEVMRGAACLAGSRLPAVTLVAMVDGGESWERIVESWPWLTLQHVNAARAWLAADGAGM